MTNKEAIQVYKDWVKRDSEMEFADRLENIELYNMAIQALEQAQAIKDAIAEIAKLDTVEADLYKTRRQLLNDAINIIRKHCLREGDIE